MEPTKTDQVCTLVNPGVHIGDERIFIVVELPHISGPSTDVSIIDIKELQRNLHHPSQIEL